MIYFYFIYYTQLKTLQDVSIFAINNNRTKFVISEILSSISETLQKIKMISINKVASLAFLVETLILVSYDYFNIISFII